MRDADLLQIVLLRAGNPAPVPQVLAAVQCYLPAAEARATLERWLMSGLVGFSAATCGEATLVLPEALPGRAIPTRIPTRVAAAARVA